MKYRKIDVRKTAGMIFAGVGLIFTIISIWMNLNVTPDRDVTFIRTVFTYLGTFILALGLFLLWLSTREQAMNTRLRKAGHYVYASVKDAVPDSSESVNGKPTWILIAEYTDDSGQTHTFRSSHFLNDPRGSMTSPFVKVFADPSDYTRYYVEL